MTGAYNKSFNELNLAGKGLTKVPNFEKYLTWSYRDDIWSINLMNNDISEVDGELFKYFPNLKELNLSYNKIEKLDLDLTFLKELQIHKNNIKKLNIENIKTLNTLNIWYNDLTSLVDIRLPKNIKTLELQHNKLTDLLWVSKLKKLEKLKLEFNELEDKNLWEIKDLENIKYITVKNNKLSKKLEDELEKIK